MLSNSHLSADHPLVAAVQEIERYVGVSGWDQPARLFALVPTADLLAAEPSLSDQIHNDDPAGLSSIEQDDFHATDDLIEVLTQIRWGSGVAGVALSVERCFLPVKFENQIPEDEITAAEFVAEHPAREDIRLVIGVLATGESHSVARLKTHPDERLEGVGMVPMLESALAFTLKGEQ